MGLNVTMSISVPPEMIDDVDEQKHVTESRSEYVRRLIREDDGNHDPGEAVEEVA